MNEIIFCTAFIIQFIGHRVGDYFLQTDFQAQNKANDRFARGRHCVVYSLTIGILMLISFEWQVAVVVFGITFLEHLFIDSRKPILWWKETLERVVGNKKFNIKEMPFFVLIEIDQTVHFMRIFIISLMIAYGIV